MLTLSMLMCMVRDITLKKGVESENVVSTTFIILFILFSQFYFNVSFSSPFIFVPFAFSFLCIKSFTKYVGTVIYSHTFHEIKMHGMNEMIIFK